MTEFTKGPWYPGHMCNTDHPCNCKSVVAEEYMGSICTIDAEGENPPLSEARANAHLIADAPELYEALNDLVRITDDGFNLTSISVAIQIARSALAKARGEA